VPGKSWRWFQGTWRLGGDQKQSEGGGECEGKRKRRGRNGGWRGVVTEERHSPIARKYGGGSLLSGKGGGQQTAGGRGRSILRRASQEEDQRGVD